MLPTKIEGGPQAITIAANLFTIRLPITAPRILYALYPIPSKTNELIIIRRLGANMPILEIIHCGIHDRKKSLRWKEQHHSFVTIEPNPSRSRGTPLKEERLDQSSFAILMKNIMTIKNGDCHKKYRVKSFNSCNLEFNAFITSKYQSIY